MRGVFSMKFIQKHPILSALSPLLLFAVLVVPYSWVNQAFLVDWLGCGCPQIDEAGNVYEPVFNANDFTACFWLAVSVATGVIAFFLSRRLFPENKLLSSIYTAVITAASLLIAYQLYRHMMWN